MPAHAMPREAAVKVEASFAETVSDYDANGTEIYVINPDVSGVTQATVANENIRPRRLYEFDLIHALKSDATFSCEIYMHATGVNAAEAAAAADTIQAKILKSACGGHDLGACEGIASGTAAEPVVEAGKGASYVAGDWGAALDTSAGTVEFARIESIDADTLTLLWDLGFTPDAGGADTFGAVITIYPNEDALSNHDDANHTTLGWLVQGEDSEDVYELRGCKPTLGAITITAGEPVKLQLAHKVVTYAEAPSAVTFSSAPSGSAPNVPGTGSTTTVKLGAFGGALSSVDCYGAITFTPGIEHEKAGGGGPNGVEGHHGYMASSVGPATLELIVPFDNAYHTAWAAKTKYHCMIQVGNTSTTAWGIYCARLEFAERPQRVDEGGVTGHRLLFRCLEDTASVSGLTGDNIDKRRAPWVLLIAA